MAKQQAIGSKRVHSYMVRELRTAAGLSQRHFAAKVGVSVRTIKRWEHSATGLELDSLPALVRFAVDRNMRGPAVETLLCAIQDAFGGRLKVLVWGN